MGHPSEEEMLAKLERIRDLANEALRTDTTGKPNYLRVTLSEIEDAAKVPGWPV